MMTTAWPPVFGTLLTIVLLYILTKKKGAKWILISFAIYFAAMAVFFKDYSDSGSILINILVYFMCLPIFYVPFVLHGIFNKWDSFFYTLIFPVGIVFTDFIGKLAIISPGMNICYRFFYVTPLIQVASLIGAAGLSFILGWFLSSVVTMIIRKFKKKYVIATVLSTLVMVSAFLFGVIRIGNADTPDRFVHAAWATGPEREQDGLEWFAKPYEENVKSFLVTSEEAAKQNAELLIYSEESFPVDEDQVEEFLKIASDRAKESNMAILLSVEIDTEDGENCENCNYFIKRNGEIAGKYIKHMVIPIVEAGFIRGDGTFGKQKETFACGETDMAISICYDGNFETYVRKMQDDADMYLYPSWDWESIENNHTMIAGFRAVENGITLLKPTYIGRSVMYDAYGRILFETHTKNGFEKVYSFDIPLSNKVTFYEKYGGIEAILFFILSGVLFVCAIASVIRKKKNTDIQYN